MGHNDRRAHKDEYRGKKSSLNHKHRARRRLRNPQQLRGQVAVMLWFEWVLHRVQEGQSGSRVLNRDVRPGRTGAPSQRQVQAELPSHSEHVISERWASALISSVSSKCWGVFIIKIKKHLKQAGTLKYKRN